MRFPPQDEDTDGSLTTEELAEALQLYDTDVKVSKRVCCDAIYAKNDRFTKTGSGPTCGKLQQRTRFQG